MAENRQQSFLVVSYTEQKPIRVLIVDDHEVVRVGLRTLFAKFKQIEVVGEAGSVGAALEAVERLKPDVVTMDVRLPDGSGYDACREIQKLDAAPRILFLTSYEDDQVIFQAINAGADGFLLKDADANDLVSAIESVHQGKSIIDPDVTRRVFGRIKTGAESNVREKFEQLSAQEKRVVALVSEGKTNKEIGVQLGLSDKTIKNYLGNAMEKLQMNRRSQVAAFYVQCSESTKS